VADETERDLTSDIISPTTDTTELTTEDRKEFLIETNFKGVRKHYFLNPKAIPLKVGEFIIVEYEDGEDMGAVSAITVKQLKRENIEISGNIIRKSNQIDIRRLDENRKIEDGILINARKQSKILGLDMKFIDIEYKFDRKKLVFYFTADGRVDFRELVKVFASEYKTRIELRQIGVRDEAQKIGGIGICGRELCCSQFLTNFVSINVSMARDQNLFVKPEKFSGACGKLQCCLKYEHDFYLSQKSGIPDTGSIIQTEKGKATVSIIDVFNGTVTLDFESGETLVMKKEDLVAKLEKAYKVIRNSKDEKSENGCSGCPKSNFLNYDGNET
jgi:cell fate regulator YaaT (PSP1 superfamily)